MKLLYYLHTLSIGGSQRSALALAKEMRKYGNEIVFAGEVQGDRFLRMLDSEGFAHVDMRFSRRPLDVWRTAQRLAAVCSDYRIDICHAYYYTNYYFAWTASLLRRMPPIAGTFCGGPGPRYHIPRLAPVVVFSEEQKDMFVARWGWKPSSLIVSPARVEQPPAEAPSYNRQSFLSQYDLDPGMLTVLFVSRLSKDKHGSVKTMQQLVREIEASGLPWQVLVAGGGELEGELQELGTHVRRSTGRAVLAAPGEQDRLDEFYACTDIVAGVGRSIFDGMMQGQPVLVVGDKGFAGLVAPESVEELAYYNFSGRNAAEDTDIEKLVAAIHLLASPDERRKLGGFARSYAADNLSVEAGGRVLLDYYDKLKGLPPPPRGLVLREVTLTAISYVRRKGLYA